MSDSDFPPLQEEDDASAMASIPLPPASFDWLVMSIKMQADMALGLIHFGEEKDRPKVDLRAARHTIDLLAVISEKTKGNLTIEEQRLVENSLTELRFRYVQATEEQNKKHQQE